ncbi:MAG: TetR/AcrR family transcriptional regulator [Cyclobacteriaceae bacterium]|nr:TetR/AcrR family transcriptional regulator [Cyclobacteriaceae bacterium]
MGITERKEREKENRRNEILDAAEKVFFKKGIDFSTMDEVAEQAELSKGTLYLYFKSKEDIRFAIFQRGAAILNSLMQKNMRTLQTGKERLISLGETFIMFSRNFSDYFRLFIEIQTSNMENLNIGKEAFEDYVRHQSPISIVQRCVMQGIQDGSIRRDIPESHLTSTLWSQMLGILMVINNHEHLFRIFEIEAADILRTHLEIAQHGSIPR